MDCGVKMVEGNFHTAVDIAYQIISQKILDGEFQPGMKLSRKKMTEITGVSAISVSKALDKLENEHLVESKPQWGAYVTVPTLDKIKECYQLREAIECQSARILASNITSDQQSELMKIATDLDTIPYTPETVIDSRKSHVLFHERLTEFTNVSLLIETLHKINLFYVLCKAISANAPQVKYPRYWHRYLVDEIAKGDPDNAEKVMRVHVNDSLTAIIAAMEK